MINVLYVDEDKIYAGELVSFLNTNDFKITYTPTSDEIEQLIYENEINIVLCNLNLEKNDQLDLLKRIKQISIPVVVISNDENSQDEVIALNNGATDFTTKSSDFEAIRIRLTNIYNNTANRLLSLEVHGKKCKLNVITRVISNNDDIYITLNQKEFLIIYNLIINKNKIIKYDELRKILAEHNDVEITEKYINVIIFRIRTKLKLYNLNSIRGKGYIWMDDL